MMGATLGSALLARRDTHRRSGDAPRTTASGISLG